MTPQALVVGERRAVQLSGVRTGLSDCPKGSATARLKGLWGKTVLFA